MDNGSWRFPVLERLWIFGNGRLPRDPEYLWEFADTQAKTSGTVGPTREGYWRWLIKRMGEGAYMPLGIGTTSFGGGSNATPSFSSVPGDAFGDSAPSIDFAQTALPSSILDDDSVSAVTTTNNPPLSATSLSNLAAVGGAAGNTVSANPTVYSTGSSSEISALSNLSSAVGQFGFSIAGLFGSQTLPTTQAMAAGRPATSSSNTSMYVLLAVVVIVVVLVVMEE